MKIDFIVVTKFSEYYIINRRRNGKKEERN